MLCGSDVRRCSRVPWFGKLGERIVHECVGHVKEARHGLNLAECGVPSHEFHEDRLFKGRPLLYIYAVDRYPPPGILAR
jgi:hypothetical protein